MRSTDTDRTITSALTNLAALFPPNGDDVWHDELPWIPIPIHTKPIDQDYTLMGPQSCAKYNALFKNYLNKSPEVREILMQNAYLFEYWSEMCGKNIDTIQEASYLYNGLVIEDHQNKKYVTILQIDGFNFDTNFSLNFKVARLGCKSNQSKWNIGKY